MRGGLVAAEQAGRAQHQGAGADAGHVLRPGAARLQEGEHFFVAHHPQGAGRPARNEQEGQLLRTLLERQGRLHHQAGVAADRLARLPDQLHVIPGEAGEHLVRPDEVEGRELRVQEEGHQFPPVCRLVLGGRPRQQRRGGQAGSLKHRTPIHHPPPRGRRTPGRTTPECRLAWTRVSKKMPGCSDTSAIDQVVQAAVFLPDLDHHGFDGALV